MMRSIISKINKLYYALGNIDSVAIKNPLSYVMAYFGNENEILKLAIKYLNENNLDACLEYLSKINIQLLLEKNYLLAEYWSLCFDIYYYKSTYDMHFNDYLEKKNYNVKWHLIKSAINDGLIRKQCQIAEALAKVEVDENDTLDFIRFVFNKINDINSLYSIFFQKMVLLKESMLYGYSNGFLNFDDLLIMAKVSNEFATALVFILKNKQLTKSISNNKLQNMAYKLGNEVAYVRYECGLICLQSGNLEKASELFSNVTKYSAHNTLAMKEKGANGVNPSIVALQYDIAKLQINHNFNSVSSDNLSSIDCPKLQSTQTIPLPYAISHETFIKAHQDYLNTRGFFSSQSAATQRVISKASRTYISDQKRFHILKKYAEKKSNFDRTFWSSIVCHFSPMFIAYDKNNRELNCTSENNIKPINH